MFEPAAVGSISPDTLHWYLMGGSALAAFVASVMGDEQSERLKNGAVGGVVGTSIGALAGLLKNQADLVIVGFFGSVLGATVGWGAYLLMALLARNPKSRTVLDFMTGGLKAVRESLYVDRPETIIPALDAWCHNFLAMARAEKTRLLAMPRDGCWPVYASGAVTNWLTTVADTFSLVFQTLAKKPEYQSRVTVIVYGKQDGKVAGKHWIHYEGQLTPFRTAQLFNDSSVGYQVLTRKKRSPYFTTSTDAQKNGQQRDDDPSYRPFYTFRLNENAVLALDWPTTLNENENDPYLKAARTFFYRDLAPLICEVLDEWGRPIASVVGLEALPARVEPLSPQEKEGEQETVSGGTADAAASIAHVRKAHDGNRQRKGAENGAFAKSAHR